MSFDVSQLESRIFAILTSPGVDLTTISAKRVRKRLLEDDPDLPPNIVKDYKDQIDAVIGKVYEQVSSGQVEGDEEEAAPPNGSGSTKKRQSGETGSGSPSKPKKQKKSGALTDEELARQLEKEINSRERSSRASAGGKVTKKSAKRGTKKKKSVATVDSEGEGAENGGEEKPKRKGGGGLTKEYALSEPLATLLNEEKLSRPQVVKRLWVYIKANNLQNPEDKREIICDATLNDIFKVDKINMFKMNKALGEHLHEPEPAAAT